MTYTQHLPCGAVVKAVDRISLARKTRQHHQKCKQCKEKE